MFCGRWNGERGLEKGVQWEEEAAFPVTPVELNGSLVSCGHAVGGAS